MSEFEFTKTPEGRTVAEMVVRDRTRHAPQDERVPVPETVAVTVRESIRVQESTEAPDAVWVRCCEVDDISGMFITSALVDRSQAAALARVLATFAEAGELRAGDGDAWSYIPSKDGEWVWMRFEDGEPRLEKTRATFTGAIYVGDASVQLLASRAVGYRFARAHVSPPPPLPQEENASE